MMIQDELYDNESNTIVVEVLPGADIIDTPYSVQFGDHYRYFNEAGLTEFIKKLQWMKKIKRHNEQKV